MLLDASALGLILALIAAFVAAGKPVLPANLREKVVHTLMSALIGPVACAEYLAALADALRKAGVTPPEVPLTELPVETLLRDGLGVLSDDQLARLAVSPAAIRALNKRVEQAMLAGAVGQVWWEVCDSVADRLPPTYLGADAIRRTADFIREVERDE